MTSKIEPNRLLLIILLINNQQKLKTFVLINLRHNSALKLQQLIINTLVIKGSKINLSTRHYNKKSNQNISE